MSVSSRKVILGSITASIAFVLELTLVPLLLPAIQTQFDLSISELSWLFNSYGAAVAVGVLMGGWLGDTFNTKRVFGVGVMFFAFGSAVVAYGGVYEAIIAGRVMQGFGGGVFSPLIPLLLTRSSPNRPGKILIVWGSVAGYVAAFAPFLYGSTLAIYNWNLAFVIFAAVSLAALAIINFSLAEDEPASLTKSGPSYFRLLRSRDLWVMFGYVFCTYGAITYYLFRLPLWLAENDFRVASIGFSLSTMWLSFSVLSTLLRNKVDEPHVRGILLAAPVLIASGFPLAYFCQDIACLVLASMLIGAGLACSNAPSTQLILKFAPKKMRAASVSLDITFARLGGVAFVAVLSQSLFGYAVVAVVLMCIFAFLCALAAAKRFNA
ncbi:MAG: MFS transporter [Silicimonas sp.]